MAARRHRHPGALALATSIVALGLLACSASGPPNVVVVLIDTLRADHLGCYGHSQPTSPRIDALAGEGTLFENAVAQSSWTGPSVASLFTSHYPSRHGMVRFGSSLDAGLPTLAEELRRGGYQTLAVSANFAFVSRRTGLLRGFDRVEELSRRAGPGEHAELLGLASVPGSTVTERAIELLANVGDGPFFLYVHYMDPHSGYEGHEPDPRRLASLAYQGPVDGSTEQLRTIVRGELAIGAADLERLVSLYDGEIARVDTEVGRLLDHLRERGLYDDSLIVLLSDHGEEFQDHGSFFHMFTLYREQIHVPLIVRTPGGSGGVRVPELVELVDVGPTLLELVGLGDARPSDGVSLVPLLRGSAAADPTDPERVAFSELHADPQVAPVWRAKRHRAALTTPHFGLLAGSEPEALELYDLTGDPRQQQDLAREDASRLGMLSRRLSEQATNVWEAAPSPERLEAPDVERLRALGYLE